MEALRKRFENILIYRVNYINLKIESQICITCIRRIVINMLNFNINLRSALLKIKKSFST